MSGVPIDILRSLTEDQWRQLSTDPVMVATKKQMYEEQQNDLTNHMVNHIAGVISAMITNLVMELVSKVGQPSQLLQT